MAALKQKLDGTTVPIVATGVIGPDGVATLDGGHEPFVRIDQDDVATAEKPLVTDDKLGLELNQNLRRLLAALVLAHSLNIEEIDHLAQEF